MPELLEISDNEEDNGERGEGDDMPPLMSASDSDNENGP
jgi:hypothetical protein